MSIVQIIIDDSTSKVITGTFEFDRDNGGTLIVPSGTSFPGTPEAKELFWRTDESKLYRRNDANDAWVAVTSAVAAHKTTHEPGGSDAMAVDAAAATGSLRTLGTSATSACAGNDARLSDARTPTAHASSHQSGGGDAIKLDDLGAPDDNIDLNATTSAHGLLPKLGGGTTNYLRADGTWATPPGGGGTDVNAIHKNVAAEISTITEKTVPACLDLLVLEDSADSNNKKRATVGSILVAEPNYFAGPVRFFDEFFPPALDDQWTTSTSGTGSLVDVQLAPGGQVLIRAGNAAGRTAELYFGGGVAWQSLNYNPDIRARMKYDGINNGHIEFEVHYADASNYVFLEADWGGNWLLSCRSGGTLTQVDTGVALDANWHTFAVRSAPGQVTAHIDDVLKATITTNIPTVSGTVSIYVAATGTGGTKNLLVDGFFYTSDRPS